METKTCELCGKKSSSSDVDTFAFELPQRGGDSCGILGFMLRDIRQAAAAAKKKICCFCKKTGANIACQKCCKRFHLACSLDHHGTSEFCGEFHSYCEECTPLDDYQRQLLANPPKNQNCDICSQVIQPFNLHRVSYGDCCRKGFAHRKCMRGYALTSGYYLRCIWCHSEKFRDIIRKQSIFVPDRDATWERQNNAYKELHRKHMRCVQETCLCPNGRDFNKNTWTICPCKLCLSTGAHLNCVAGISRQARGTVDFICDICQDVEKKILLSNQHRSMRTALDIDPTEEGQIDISFYVSKSTHDPSVHSNSNAVPIFSDDESSVSDVSVITVIASQERAKKLDLVEAPKKLEEEIIVLPDSQLTSQPDLESFSGLAMWQTVTEPAPAPAPDPSVRSNSGFFLAHERAKKLDLVEAPKKLEEEIIVLPDSQLTSQPDLASFSGLAMWQTVTEPAPAPDPSVHSNSGSVSVFSDEEQSQNFASNVMTVLESQQTSSGATNEEETVTLPLNSSDPTPDVQSHCQSDQESDPGLVISKSFSCPGEPFFYVVVLTFDERRPERCTGSCTLRFADADPRLKDRSLEALQSLQITREDIWSRSTNRGVLELIHLENRD